MKSDFQRIRELEAQVARLEAQLSVALEIMSDGMVEQFQEEFQRDIQIPDSDTIKKAEE